jgi:hypothetical protein
LLRRLEQERIRLEQRFRREPDQIAAQQQRAPVRERDFDFCTAALVDTQHNLPV